MSKASDAAILTGFSDEFKADIDAVDSAGKFVCGTCGKTINLSSGCMHVTYKKDGTFEKVCSSCN